MKAVGTAPRAPQNGELARGKARLCTRRDKNSHSSRGAKGARSANVACTYRGTWEWGTVVGRQGDVVENAHCGLKPQRPTLPCMRPDAGPTFPRQSEHLENRAISPVLTRLFAKPPPWTRGRPTTIARRPSTSVVCLRAATRRRSRAVSASSTCSSRSIRVVRSRVQGNAAQTSEAMLLCTADDPHTRKRR